MTSLGAHMQEMTQSPTIKNKNGTPPPLHTVTLSPPNVCMPSYSRDEYNYTIWWVPKKGPYLVSSNPWEKNHNNNI